jgi:Spy/CpxP family protein refolding chaperone
MKRTLLILTIALAACSSSDYDQPRNEGPRRGGGGMMTPRVSSDGTGLLPPADWWHDPQIAGAVNLTADQYSALDALSKNQPPDLDKLRRDVGTASRDLRTLLETEKPSPNEIITAGDRVKSLRDEIFTRELRLLADERSILTQQQWNTLQRQLTEQRQERGGYGRDGYGGRRGGRGGWGRPPGSGGVYPY